LRRFRTRLAVAAGAVTLVAAAAATPAAAAAADPVEFVPVTGSTHGLWTDQDLEVGGANLAWMSANDVTTIPAEPDGGTWWYDHKVWQYDGVAWKMLPALPGSFYFYVPSTVVTGTSTDNVWVFRESQYFRWNGTAWSEPTSFGHKSVDADAVSQADVWSVGTSTFADGTSGPGAAHWNGSTWTQAALPKVSGRSVSVLDVEAVAANDVWVLGYSSASSTTSVYLAHWDGAAWRTVAAPSTTARGQYASALHVRGSEVWVGGSTTNGRNLDAKSVAYRLTGSTWTTFVPPGNGVKAFAGDGSSLLAQVGYYNLPGSPAGSQLQRFTGTAWVDHPSGPSGFAITHMAGIPGGGAWLAGDRYISGKRTASLGRLAADAR
jgi:hypothetical protein